MKIDNLILQSLFAVFLSVSAFGNQPQIIRPGEIWPDERGLHLQAHGGGVIKLGHTYYWFGEDRSRDNAPDKRFVSCYSSTDLTHWQFRNQVLKLTNVANLNTNWVVERPKVFYNERTKKFVMYFHLDGAPPGENTRAENKTDFGGVKFRPGRG